ncbi:hypothetical protein DEJ50_06920 [Streptomyces venezuelae]|uniref:Uncharacterized protein n=1 Tax=Streptomyces venezuelae TaxID=54571 RepID=A0A5P2CXK2_STRVZ|nr:hypothetical protein [Streptomyces venezuelae]QES47595.1 hypothetical protein DEJ50_06920 [Streptomyces venezuelae]
MTSASVRTALVLLSIAVALMTAVLAGAAAGCLARRDRATYPAALSRAGAAFAATLGLAAALTAALAAVTGG